MPRTSESAETESPEIRRGDGPVYRSILLPSPPEENGEENGASSKVPVAPKSDQALADAMAPVLRENVLKALRENPQIVIDIVYPVIGRVIRKSISESIRALMTAIEKYGQERLQHEAA